MRITANIILDWLKDYSPKCSENFMMKRSIEKVLFINGVDELCFDILYIVDLSSLHSIPQENNENLMLLCTSNTASQLKSRGFKGSMIILDESVSLNEVSNCVNEGFLRFLAWEKRMDKIILGNEGLQELINVSEEFFNNPVLFITVSLLIPAVTQNIPCDDPEINYAKVHHTYPAKMITQLIRDNILVDAESINELTYLERTYHRCPVLVRTFPDNMMQLKAVFLFNLNTPPTDVEYDILQILSDKTEEYVRLAGSSISASFDTEVYDQLLVSVIEGTATIDEIDAYKALMRVEDNSAFQVHVICFKKYIKSQVFYTMRLISDNLPSARTFIYQNHIVIVETADDSSEKKAKYIQSFLEQVLADKNSYCGSARFTCLSNLQYAYHMACSAADIGIKLNPEKSNFNYSDVFIYHLIESASSEVPLELLYSNALDRIVEYDRLHNTDNMALLKCFLEHDRNYTQVANIMHLHRNSVSYRINKIEELLGVSLDDSDERLKLLISFKVLNMKDNYN